MISFNNSIPEISLDGFKVVSGDMFAHLPRKGEPTCTLWYDSISFSMMALQSLNNCERVRIEVNPKTKCVLVVPVTIQDKDGIRWVQGENKITSRKIYCRAFSSQLYATWKFSPQRVYRAKGKLVSSDQKVMLLFDFSKPENWQYREGKKHEI